MKDILKVLKILLIVLLIDGIVNALPSAYIVATTGSYIGKTDDFSITSFLSATWAYTILYIYLAFLIYLLLVTVFTAIIMNINKNLLNSLLTGILTPMVFYLIYSFNWSFDSRSDYFIYRLVWYSFLGGLFGYIYYKKILLFNEI